jgi:DNA repair exonuclease SbcCD ATPase subunit
MRLKRVEAKNFLSFRELAYDFVDHPVLIQGQNLSDEGQESNGACKSGLFNVVELCLFNDVSRDQLSSDLIHIGEDLLEASLEIECPLRKQTIKIERRIHATKGGSSQLSVNGVIRHAFEDRMTTEINSFVIEWIGLSRKDMQNYFLINGESSKPFFKSSNTENIELISRFSNVNLIDGVEKEVLADVSSMEKELSRLTDNRISLLSKVRTLKEQVDRELNRDFEREMLETKDSLLTQIQSLENEIEDATAEIERANRAISDSEALKKIDEDKLMSISQRLDEAEARMAEVSKSLDEIVDPDFSDNYIILDNKIASINQKRTKIKEDKAKKKRDLDEILDMLKEVEQNLRGTVKCPKCSHEFNPGDPDISIVEERQAKKDIENVIEKLERQMRDFDDRMEDLILDECSVDSERKELKDAEKEIYEQKKEVKTKINSLLDEIRVIKQERSRAHDSISSRESEILFMKTKIKNHKENIKNNDVKITSINNDILHLEKSSVDQKRIDSLWAEMRAIGKNIRDLNHSITRKKRQIFETRQWEVRFKRFRIELSNKFLKVIQGYCNKFLQDMGSDIQMRIEGYKEKADGSLTDKITPYIIREGKVRRYGSFSKGERGRINLATMLAIAEIINKTHRYGGLDNLMADESLEGVDPAGLGLVMKSVDRLKKPLMLTTHVTDRNISSSVLLVRKQEGISTLITQ